MQADVQGQEDRERTVEVPSTSPVLSGTCETDITLRYVDCVSDSSMNTHLPSGDAAGLAWNHWQHLTKAAPTEPTDTCLTGQ